MSAAPIVTPGDQSNLDELRESRRVSGLSTSSLASVRALAEKWRNASGIAAILAAGLAFISGPDSVNGLPESAIVVLVIAAAIAALSGVLSLILSMSASFGWPDEVLILDAGSLRNWERRAVKNARRELFWSLVLSVVCLSAVIVAVSVVVFAKPTTSSVEVTLRDGNKACYSSVVEDGDDLVGISGDARAKIDLADVASIASIQDCGD